MAAVYVLPTSKTLRGEMTAISERLAEALSTYGHEGDPLLIQDLGEDVRSGALSWFPEEFERALRAGAFTPQWWGEHLYNDEWTDEEADELDEDLRTIWNAIAPDRPYPLDSQPDNLDG